MSLLSFLPALLLQAAPVDALPNVEDPYSAVEGHIDDALEHMIAAQTYICDDLRGPSGATAPRRQYEAVDRRYFSALAAAEAQMQRRLKLRVWTNSCRMRDPGQEFRKHLRAANASLEAAEQLLQ